MGYRNIGSPVRCPHCKAASSLVEVDPDGHDHCLACHEHFPKRQCVKCNEKK